MRRKLFAVLLLLLFAVCGAFVISACNEDEKQAHTQHIWGEWQVVTPSDCETDGLKRRSCEVCNQTEDEVIPAEGHKITNPQTVQPTCTEDGYSSGKCSVCGETVTQNIPALGHDWDDGEMTQIPTCVRGGLKDLYLPQ